MKPVAKPQKADFSAVKLSAEEDELLKEMQSDLSSIFRTLSHRYSSTGLDSQDMSALAAAATGYAAICAEQRERQMLRAIKAANATPTAKQKKTP